MQYKRDKIDSLRARWETPKGKAFLKRIKESRCYLSPVLFREKARNFPGIKDREVSDGIDLRGAPLSGFDFRVPIQEDDEGYSEEVTIISGIHFEGASLKHCNFSNGKIHQCYFDDAELSHAIFENASIHNSSFKGADCSGIDVHGTKLINSSFVDTVLRDVTMDTTIVDERTTFGEVLASEKESDFHSASIEYKQIKEMYKNSSHHSIADKYHYKEMVSKRKTRKKNSPLRILSFIFGDMLSKYGTSYLRVFCWSILFIVVCANLFFVNKSLLFHNSDIAANFWDSLYFSMVTFTTLGYGDFHAIGALRFLAATEAFAGAAMMSLFTVIVARNIIRE